MRRDNILADEALLTYLFETHVQSFSEKLTLETNEDFFYLSDIDTYELYLISAVDPEKIVVSWKGYEGRKCYEVLQNRKNPCPFCTNAMLSQDQYYIWKHYNEIIDKDYILKDKLVEWEGKLVRMEVVMDVSNAARIDEVLRRSLDGQNILSSCIRPLLESEGFEEVGKALLTKVCRFFYAEKGFIEYFGEKTTIIQWNSRTEEYETSYLEAVAKENREYWGKLLGNGKQMIIMDSSLLKEDEKVGKRLVKNGIQSICLTPIFGDKRLLGFIGVENIKAYWTELALLTMLASHISTWMLKEELQYQNERIQYYDTTTGYLNFEGFKRKAEKILQDNPEKYYALWYSDLKNFKYINDVCSYDTGDRFLKYWADSIAETMRPYETFGRISGDKFIVLRCYEKREELAERFHVIDEKLRRFAVENKRICMELASGAYLMERLEDRLSINEILDRANIAEKSIKGKPGSNMAFYDEAMRLQAVQEMEKVASLKEALEKEEFLLYLQPQVSLKKGGCFRAEALVRWRTEAGELRYPVDFIELFERTGMIAHLDHYMFEHTCRYLKSWKGEKPLRLSVNVSRVTMLQPDFVETYCRLKEENGIPDGSIELEFTETVVVENHEVFQDIVKQLKKHGFGCAMDDFGADQSSLNILKDIPMDVLKLDRKFFDEEEAGGRREAVVACILKLASALNMETVAEGIETWRMVEILRLMGCDYIQGYIYARPMPAEEYKGFTTRNTMAGWLVQEEQEAEKEAGHRRNQESMMKYIPGGVHKCLADSWFTLVEVSESFLAMTGYTEEDIEILFHNRFLEIIWHEDRERVLQTVEKQIKTGDLVELEYRIQMKNGDLVWILDKGRTVVEEDGRRYIYCVLLDTSQQNQERQELRTSLEQAYLDSLTGLLNKGTVSKKIVKLMEEKQPDQGVLLLIDLDDFKLVNDRYGHLCGDAVLTELAGELKRMFRKDDILGRVGGDEFLAFLPNITKEDARMRIESLLKRLAEIKINHKKGLVSCSIGAACFPGDADGFQELYHCADQALYHMKSEGKGGLSFYTKEIGQTEFAQGIVRTAVNAVIDSDQESVNKLLAEYSLHMLYNAIETQTAIDSMLEIVGRSYDVSRVYIFEDSADGRICNNTFEWCNTGIESQIHRLQGIRYGEDIGDYHKNFNEEGVFYCKDIRTLEPVLYEMLHVQGICSLLQCSIVDDGKSIGYVGFDECRENRYWTREQIDSLTLISKVLGTFLLKQRLKQKIKMLEEKTGE